MPFAMVQNILQTAKNAAESSEERLPKDSLSALNCRQQSLENEH